MVWVKFHWCMVKMKSLIHNIVVLFCFSLFLSGCSNGNAQTDVGMSEYTENKEQGYIEAGENTTLENSNELYIDRIFLSEISGGKSYRLICSDPAGGLMEKRLEYCASEGAAWEQIADLTAIIPNYPQAMAFLDEKTGIIITDYHGNRNYIFLTEDGGFSWDGVYLGEVADSYTNGIDLSYDLEKDLLSITVCAKISDDEYEERVYFSEDHGQSWSRSK